MNNDAELMQQLLQLTEQQSLQMNRFAQLVKQQSERIEQLAQQTQQQSERIEQLSTLVQQQQGKLVSVTERQEQMLSNQEVDQLQQSLLEFSDWWSKQNEN